MVAGRRQLSLVVAEMAREVSFCEKYGDLCVVQGREKEKEKENMEMENKEKEQKRRKIEWGPPISFMEMMRNMLEQEAKEDAEEEARKQELKNMEEEDMMSRQVEERRKRAMVDAKLAAIGL